MRERPGLEESFDFVEVQIDQPFQDRVRPEAVRQAALATLDHQRIVGPFELTLVVTDDEVLHELNLRHRQVDAPTDVLAFPDETRAPFVDAPGLPRYLGDVIISFPRAQAQATEAGHEAWVEVQLLAVHGVLHLLGYDDETEEQRARMWEVQAEILRAMGVEVHLPVW